MDGAVLAQLMRQGAERGVDLVTLRAIVEEAGELGAARALARVALSDERAREDVAELRELLAAWRDAKRSVWKAVVGWIARLAMALMLAGLAVKLGFAAWLK
ncbi:MULTISPECIES: DUF6127 family protein [Sphingomonas]|jgi:hypothetical protein|uniref:DUF1640 domain-containing protein n=1 Tax=Sphingomonas albertensis TaxID=2762591 RepID=A0ABR7AK03_9SPHN|nr:MULTISPECIES: DUF6127 family protein [Sphingomonas]MBC3940774.1 hypothetical protein [Sphingomonas albertensis]MBD8618908.1 hypothetical protein [Sphingomonas sp. CFBP 13728]MBE2993135.1 hypothetical protein [Sphingomonas sp. CFBP 13603]MCK8457547.1 DUF6127 family protein [Sphingomonas faeni]MCP8891851.1 DUF6127 family protein [Sphingomonas faeni]